jgi:hypothetical protein
LKDVEEVTHGDAFARMSRLAAVTLPSVKLAVAMAPLVPVAVTEYRATNDVGSWN